MSGRPKFYITTAISYPNGQPHIGHAYEAIATDAIARFERLDGKDVFFLTGTDEHGLKMKQTAAKEGLTPRELADRNAKRFREMAGLLGLTNDDFIRTTEPRHYLASEEVWRRMDKAGDIFLKKYAGWYSVRDEAYYNESETVAGDDGIRIKLTDEFTMSEHVSISAIALVSPEELGEGIGAEHAVDGGVTANIHEVVVDGYDSVAVAN
jgi:methionyl-tRNA synthetase